MRYLKIVVVGLGPILGVVAIAAVLAQQKCQADSAMYALSFDCATVKGVIRFLMFWKPAYFPFSL